MTADGRGQNVVATLSRFLWTRGQRPSGRATERPKLIIPRATDVNVRRWLLHSASFVKTVNSKTLPMLSHVEQARLHTTWSQMIIPQAADVHLRCWFLHSTASFKSRCSNIIPIFKSSKIQVFWYLEDGHQIQDCCATILIYAIDKTHPHAVALQRFVKRLRLARFGLARLLIGHFWAPFTSYCDVSTSWWRCPRTFELVVTAASPICFDSCVMSMQPSMHIYICT